MRANIYLVGDGLLLWYASSWAVIGFRQKAERLASTPLWSRESEVAGSEGRNRLELVLPP